MLERCNEWIHLSWQITIIDINKQTQPQEFTDAVTRAIISGWSRNKSKDDNQRFSRLEEEKIKRGLVYIVFVISLYYSIFI